MSAKVPTVKAKSICIYANTEFVRALRIVATHRNLTMPEVLDKYALPALDREYRKVLGEMNRDLGGEG